MSKTPLYIIGLGPGDSAFLSPMATFCLEKASVIVGYTLYINLIEPSLLANKQIISTGMRQEVQRCKEAIQAALAGTPTAIVSSGDAGIYGMAGLIYELLPQFDLKDELEVITIPGIPAVCAAAAILGAPLMHDFACISLSDLLTPWDKIVKRLHAAFSADFVVAIYNPKSRGRSTQLAEALDIAKKYHNPSCPIGLVRNACRPEQKSFVCTLESFNCDIADMLSIIIVGNSATKIINEKIITPRGYGV